MCLCVCGVVWRVCVFECECVCVSACVCVSVFSRESRIQLQRWKPFSDKLLPMLIGAYFDDTNVSSAFPGT